MRTSPDRVLKSLSDPTRRALFERLSRKGEQTVRMLTDRSGVSQPAVSKHLAVLRSAGLVRARPSGRETHYTVQPKALAPLVDWMSYYSRFWHGRLDRLEDLLTRMEPMTPMRPAADSDAASTKITKRIEDLGGWRGEMLATLRKLIHDADPAVVEEWKWEKPSSGGVPIFSHDGIVCTGEAYKEVVKLTFAKGASVPDPKKLFNASLEGSTRRAIDFREGEKVNAAAFKALIKAAVAVNAAAAAKKKSPKK